MSLENQKPEETNETLQKNSFFLKKMQRSILTITLICMCATTGIGFASGYYLRQQQTSALPNTTQNKTPTFIQTSDKISGTEGKTVAMIAQENLESVVEIQTESANQNNFFSNQQGAGSGVIVSEDGYIITNNHVVDGATTITVRLSNGQSHNATVVAVDKKTDLALLKIEATQLKAVTFGNSDTLSVGESAVAIGNPLGVLGGTVTDGIISALDREITLEGETMNLLQTNAAINPGNSGGGLFNSNGELIGIIVAKSSGSDIEGLGFAIPGNEVKTIIEQLREHGYVLGRIELGLTILEIATPQQAMMYRVNETGLYISAIKEGSNALKAGLSEGDLIQKVNGTSINTMDDLKKAIKDLKVNDKIKFTLKDGLKTKTIEFTLQEYIQAN